MPVRDELLITKDIHPGQELLLSILLTRELVSRWSDERLFKPAGITDQQFNVMRILKGGPPEGSLIREIRRRILTCRADVPRLVDRMVRGGLVTRREDPADRRGCRVSLTPRGAELEARLAPVHDALCREVEELLSREDREALQGLLDAFRAGIQRKLRQA
ncbi:MarR family winged helix-turn-helix transcriptional regulator [Mesoterricola silvestris]|uniref:MarR family transcriptional regulator n=1 Tax=Mesoterricola silvestris TaxID=2927979 RepID=A0AA48GFW0_9BACT|nr:MarR family winged helix-turn-helix transcriptional regulator [Mesoterricola silvestris]BDU71966.1 MarR family transcriptional regulator [Mesoterricola silvestris]